jgi:WD40 repeat protein
MTNWVENPYVGPRAFTVAERNRFFGREREARELLSRVVAERLVLFYAQSGAGKTSLINTSLIPQLKDEGVGYAVLPVGRVSGDLPKDVQDVANIFIFNLLLHLDQSNRDPGRFAAMNLKDFLVGLRSDDGEFYYYDASIALAADRGEYETSVYVLIIDQFEEIFSTHLERWQDREDFFRQLDEAMAADPKFWVVLSLREDYVAELDPYAPLLATRMRARFYMQRMGYQAALEAVRQPAEQYGRPFTPGVAEHLVDNLRQIRIQGETAVRLGEFVEPVQLQVVCYQLWEKLKGRKLGSITAEDVQQLGDVDSALADFYEQAIARTVQAGAVSEVQLREWFSQKLITEARTRGTVYVGKTQTAGLANEVVKSLAEQYLLRGEMRAGGMWVELVHDRFVEPILRANERWLGSQSRLVQDAMAWEHADQDDSKLYVGEALEAALASVGQGRQELVVTAFLAASQEKNQALVEAAQRREREMVEAAQRRELEATRKLAGERQRRNWILTAAVVVSLLLTITASWFFWQAEQARSQAEQAKLQAKHEKFSILTQLVKQRNDKSNFTQGLLASLEILQESQKEIDEYLTEAEIELYRAVSNLRERFILQGHRRQLTYAVFSPDGTRLATASDDNTVCLWDTASGQLLHILSGHERPVVKVAFNLDGTRLATASSDNTARLWDTASGQLLYTLSGHQGSVVKVAFNPDGTRLATASRDNTARLWDTANGKLLNTLSGHTDWVNDVAFNPHGTRLATASRDNTARLWDLQATDPSQKFQVLRGHTEEVVAVAFNPDGTRLATASYDNTARLWDLQATDPNQKVMVLRGHTEEVVAVAFNPDGTRLATASRDNTAQLWNTASGQLLKTLRGHEKEVVAVAFNPDGTRLATASRDNTARLWNTASDQLFATLSGHEGAVVAVDFSRNSTRLATASADHTARLWDAATARPWDTANGQLFNTLSGHEKAVVAVAFNPDGTRLATASSDNTARLWDTTSGQLLNTLSGHEKAVVAVAFSPDGTRLATTSADHTARLWDTASGQLLTILRGHEKAVVAVAFNPDGTRLATASRDKTAWLWDTANGKLLNTLSGHTDSVNDVAFNPDSTRLATASDDNTARLWDTASGQLLNTLSGHEKAVVAVAFSPDGTRLATTSADHTARLWDTASGQLLAILSGHEKAVVAVAFNSDGTRLATASSDNTARLWNTASGQLLYTLRDHERPVVKVAFNPDGTRLATASSDNTARLWDTTTGRLLNILSGHADWVNDVAFNPDGTRLATASNDHTARLWPIFSNDKELIEYAKRIKPRLSDGETVKPRELTFDECEQYLLPMTALAWSQKGEKLASQGEIDEALSAYEEASKIDENQISALSWDALCWEGILWGQMEKVNDACAKAFSLGLEDGRIVDTRGLVRALKHDFKGAIKDFDFYVKWLEDHNGSKRKIEQRKKWITDLQADRNPFEKKEVLEGLR